MDDEGRRSGREGDEGGEGILDSLFRAVFGAQPRRSRPQEASRRVVSLPEAEPFEPEFISAPDAVEGEDEVVSLERLEGEALQDPPPPSLAIEDPPASEEVEPPIATERRSRDRRERGDLEHPDVSVRLAALGALADVPDEAPVVAVTARLQDPEPRVRQAAIEVVEAMGDDRALLLLLDAMQDPAEDVRRAAREALARRRSPALLDLLRRELAVRAHARTAATILAEMRQVEPLAEAARRPETRAPVREAVEETGVLDELLARLEDRDADRRRTACEQLGAMEVREAVEPLIDRLGDPDRGVRIKAADALSRIGDRGALHALKRSFIWDPDASVVLAAGNAIRRLSPGSPGRP